MKFQIFVLTNGNGVVFETLDSVKKFTSVPYNLQVWYQVLNDSDKLDMDLYKRFFTYTNDVVLCSKNQKPAAASGISLIYSDYDYFLGLDQDNVLLEGYFDNIMKYFYNFRRVAFVGQGTDSEKVEGEFEINNPLNLPDGGGMISREAINDVGAHAAFFPKYGFDPIEWLARFIIKGWKVIHVKNILKHGGKFNRSHESSLKMEDRDRIVNDSARMQLIADKIGYKHYNWWANKI